MVCCKALKTLGFNSRLATVFIFDSPSKLLYCTLIRPILEYGVVFKYYFAANDSPARKCSKPVSSFCWFSFRYHSPHDYSAVATKVGLVSLANHRHLLCVKFLKELLSGCVASFDLFFLLNFQVLPCQNRFDVPFHISIYSSNYIKK